MSLLFAVVIGILMGYLGGGRLEGLATLTLRWWWLAFGGLLVQVVLFSTSVNTLVGDAGPLIYVVSTVAVLTCLVRNVQLLPGLAIVAVGATANLAAIIANGGYMPASPAAVAVAGRGEETAYSNSRELARPALAPLTDIFAIPQPVPFSNVFSIGDVLIAVGVASATASAMRGGGTEPRSDRTKVRRQRAAGRQPR